MFAFQLFSLFFKKTKETLPAWFY